MTVLLAQFGRLLGDVPTSRQFDPVTVIETPQGTGSGSGNHHHTGEACWAGILWLSTTIIGDEEEEPEQREDTSLDEASTDSVARRREVRMKSEPPNDDGDDERTCTICGPSSGPSSAASRPGPRRTGRGGHQSDNVPRQGNDDPVPSSKNMQEPLLMYHPDLSECLGSSPRDATSFLDPPDVPPPSRPQSALGLSQKTESGRVSPEDPFADLVDAFPDYTDPNQCILPPPGSPLTPEDPFEWNDVPAGTLDDDAYYESQPFAEESAAAARPVSEQRFPFELSLENTDLAEFESNAMQLNIEQITHGNWFDQCGLW